MSTDEQSLPDRPYSELFITPSVGRPLTLSLSGPDKDGDYIFGLSEHMGEIEFDTYLTHEQVQQIKEWL